MAQFGKGVQSSNAIGFFAHTRMATVESQTKSICSTYLGTTFGSITNTSMQNCKNALITEYLSLDFDSQECIIMSEAAAEGWALALERFGGGPTAGQLASGAAIGAYAGILAAEQSCCPINKDSIVTAAVMGGIACFQSTLGHQVPDIQAAWNDLVNLGVTG